MMVVTEVNGCRSAIVSLGAVHQPVSSEELRVLLSGQIPEGSPPEEIPALLYARHWAESDAKPDPEASRGLVETYHDEKASMIHVILRMIRAGNLMGNSWDYFLNRMSFGCLGLTTRTR